MSTLAEEDPVRSIRNALERVERRKADRDLPEVLTAEFAIIRTALLTIEHGGAVGFSRCAECGRDIDPGTDCGWCDLFSVRG